MSVFLVAVFLVLMAIAALSSLLPLVNMSRQDRRAPHNRDDIAEAGDFDEVGARRVIRTPSRWERVFNAKFKCAILWLLYVVLLLELFQFLCEILLPSSGRESSNVDVNLVLAQPNATAAGGNFLSPESQIQEYQVEDAHWPNQTALMDF